MRTNRPIGELQSEILEYLLKHGPGGELYDPRGRWEYPESHVPWSAIAFLGRTPTASDRSALAGSLAALEERGLVIRRKAGEKGVRTTHVILTGLGQRAAEKLGEGNETLDSRKLQQDAERKKLVDCIARLEAGSRALDQIPMNGTGRLQSDTAEGQTGIFDAITFMKGRLQDLEE